MHLSPARILNFIRREAVLCARRWPRWPPLFVPPSAAYILFLFPTSAYCACFFCLMAVVAGLRGCGLFEGAGAAPCFAVKKTLRFLALMLVLLPAFFSSMLVTN